MTRRFDVFAGATNAVLPVHAPPPQSAADILRSIRAMTAALPPPPLAGLGAFGRSFAAPPGSLRIVEAAHMVETVEDWSDVRSPARAARRRRRGHPQRIFYVSKPKPDVYQIGDTLIMHPDTAAKVRAKLGEGNR